MGNDAKATEAVNGSAQPTIGQRLADRVLVDGALNRAAREAVLDHARAGNPVATMRNGNVVWLQPNEIFALVAELDKKNGGFEKA